MSDVEILELVEEILPDIPDEIKNKIKEKYPNTPSVKIIYADSKENLQELVSEALKDGIMEVKTEIIPLNNGEFAQAIGITKETMKDISLIYSNGLMEKMNFTKN